MADSLSPIFLISAETASQGCSNTVFFRINAAITLRSQGTRVTTTARTVAHTGSCRVLSIVYNTRAAATKGLFICRTVPGFTGNGFHRNSKIGNWGNQKQTQDRPGRLTSRAAGGKAEAIDSMLNEDNTHIP